MPVLVDTNVIVDVLTDDPQWAEWSIAQLEANAGIGLIINPWYMLNCVSAARQLISSMMSYGALRLTYQEIPRQGLYRAAKAFALYRRRQGTRTSVLPDFFIGGHAEAVGMSLLTRDIRG